VNAAVRCPRCGYDLRGVVQAWDQSCPLEGTCTECGLGFDWSRVLRSELYEPPWCVEFAPRGVRPFIGSCMKTMVRTLWPWAYWKRMNMALEVRWRRLAGYVACLLCILLGSYMLEQSTVATQLRQNANRDYDQEVASARSKITELTEFQEQLAAELIRNDGANELAARIRSELSRCRARIASLRQFVRHESSQSRRNTDFGVITEAVFTPYAERSSYQRLSKWTGWEPYFPPREIHYLYFRHCDPEQISFLALDVVQQWIVGIASALLLIVLIPIEFVLLPVSMRRARVRWRHIGRITAHSLALPIIVITSMFVAVSTAAIVQQFDGIVFLALRHTAWIPSLAVVVWWAVAIRHYLKIPRGWLIVLLFTILSGLLVQLGEMVLAQL